VRAFARILAAIALMAGVTAGIATAANKAGADEVTISQDQLRTGWDQHEPALSPQVLQGGTFGQLFSTAVSGQVYAQPLAIGGNLLVATETNHVYSLNAETGAINWQLSLGPSWSSSVVGCGDLTPDIGITSTPVYDPSTGTAYVTAVVNDGPSLYAPDVYLIAINVQAGTVAWKVPIQGAPVNDPTRPFNSLTERQRASLLLLNGEVYMAFASYCDFAPYVGYVAGVNTTTHALTMWSDESGLTDDQAGIWMSGGGLMSDGTGRIFVSTGNGVSPAAGPGTSPPRELGDSVVRLSVQSDGSLAAKDFFSPASAPSLDAHDKDFGSGGPVGLPFGTAAYPHLLVQAGKDGRVFLLNRDGLGGRTTSTDRVVSMTGPYLAQFGHPAAFAGSGGANYVYYFGVTDYLRALKFNATNPPTLTDAGDSPATFGYSSGSPVVTSNGTDPASAVVWQVYSSGRSGSHGTLEAFKAIPSGGKLTQIWSAPIGIASEFAVPATDNGRVYVGTRDGHVIGFGSPSKAPLTGSPVSFPATAVGSSAPATATMTASTQVTVTGVTESSASSPDPFTVGQPSVNNAPASFPVTLNPGDTLTVPVTFAPTVPGGATGALAFATNTTNFSAVNLSLSGTGTQTGLYATPASLQFGSVPTGASNSLKTVITNGGTADETVTNVTPPGAPFTVSGLPAISTVIHPGASIAVTVTYTPTGVTSDTGSLSVTGSLGGTVATVGLGGTGVAGQGTLTASPSSVSFGTVSLGQQATQSITVTNTGNLPMTITGFTAPAVPFGTPNPVTSGITLNPDDDIKIPVTFTPQSLSAISGNYVLTASDGQNPAQTLTIGVSGSGAAPAAGVAIPSPGGGWTVNGSAQMTGTTLRLTPAATNQRGSAIYYQPVASDGLRAQFTAQIGGGSGADGMTFALLDASQAALASLGGGGAKLGFGGLPGVAVTLDTYQSTGYPSANFIGIATGANAGGLIFAATSTSVPNLRSGTHVVGVTVSGSTIAVTVDGKAAVSASNVTMPPTVLAAFTGATGGVYDVHAVSAVSITSGSTRLPAPGGGWSYNGAAVMSGSDTRLTQAVNNQRGSVVYPTPVSTGGVRVQFNAQIGGGTGADGMTFAMLNPTLPATALGSGTTGLGFAGLSGVAVAFDTHQVTGYPSGNFAGIATGASNGVLKFAQTVNLFPPLRTGTHNVGVSVGSGVITVFLDGAQILQARVSLPPEVLLAFTGATSGLNDIHAMRNAAISANKFALPPPGGPCWKYNGSAAMSGSTLVLTTATKSEHGSAFNCHSVPSAGLTADFTATIGGGNGADGMTFALLDATKAGDASLGLGGGGLGFAGLPGVAVTLDTYPKVNLIGIATSTAGGTLTYVKRVTLPWSLRTANSLRVSVSATGVITVYFNKIQVLTATVKVPPNVLAGFTGSTGSYYDAHKVSNVAITL
jgi:hypothetical protein